MYLEASGAQEQEWSLKIFSQIRASFCGILRREQLYASVSKKSRLSIRFDIAGADWSINPDLDGAPSFQCHRARQLNQTGL